MNELDTWLFNLYGHCVEEWHLQGHEVSNTVWIFEFNKACKN